MNCKICKSPSCIAWACVRLFCDAVLLLCCRYLRLIITHKVLGKCSCLESFLTQTQVQQIVLFCFLSCLFQTVTLICRANCIVVLFISVNVLNSIYIWTWIHHTLLPSMDPDNELEIDLQAICLHETDNDYYLFKYVNVSQIEFILTCIVDALQLSKRQWLMIMLIHSTTMSVKLLISHFCRQNYHSAYSRSSWDALKTLLKFKTFFIKPIKSWKGFHPDKRFQQTFSWGEEFLTGLKLFNLVNSFKPGENVCTELKPFSW